MYRLHNISLLILAYPRKEEQGENGDGMATIPRVDSDLPVIAAAAVTTEDAITSSSRDRQNTEQKDLPSSGRVQSRLKCTYVCPSVKRDPTTATFLDPIYTYRPQRTTENVVKGVVVVHSVTNNIYIPFHSIQ